MTERETRFRSDDLHVRHVSVGGNICVVTFGSYTNEPSLDRDGFGENFLRDAGIDAIHVINRQNRWYQHPETGAALAAVAEVATGYHRVLTYGSSMGGYAALRFARACGASTAIALSPQFSVDPRVAPFERRWQGDVARVAFAELPYVPADRAYVFYDSLFAPDRRHADMLGAAGNMIAVPIPHGGHPVGALLVETGVLKDAIRDIAAGCFDVAATLARVRQGRNRSPHHLFFLARRAAPRHPDVAISLLRRAAAIEPESHIVSALAVQLDRKGELSEAGALHQAAIDRTPHNFRARANYALHLERIGDHPAASAQLTAALIDQSASIRLLIRTLQFRFRLRRMGLGFADRAFESIARRAEKSPRYAAMLRALSKRVA